MRRLVSAAATRVSQARGLATAHQHGRHIGLLGACFDQGQPHVGVGKAPQLIRQGGLVQRLEEKGFIVTDYGDISKPRIQGKRETSAVLDYNREIAREVERVVARGQLCLTLGGDHSVGLGTVAGHLAADPEAVVIWVDAHADINTLSSSVSGNVHGMPVSFNILELQEDNKKHLPSGQLDWLSPRLAASRIAYIGLRDVEEEEWSHIHRLSISAFSMKQIDRIGIAVAVQTALHTLDPLGKRRIHLSFDIDALDPKEAPATGTKVRGGLTLREALTLCEIIQETGRLAGMDLVEVNPHLAKSQADLDLTLEAAMEVILAAMGTPTHPTASQ